MNGSGPSGSLAKNGSVGGQFSVQTGQSIQVQYTGVRADNFQQWYNETKTITFSQQNGLFMLTTPWLGAGVQSGGTPTYGRCRNLTTGGAWQDFGQQIPAMYP